MSQNDAPDDFDAPPTEEELAAAESLRAALEGDRPASREAELARALKVAHAPTDLSPAANERLIAAMPAVRPRRSNVIRVMFGGGVATMVAAAAAFAMVVGRQMPEPKSSAATSLAQRRSTEALFDAPFPREGGESARVDRIASARAHDLRENRFARWGVR
jgi:hypothetical protein